MVTQNMLRRHEGKLVFSEEKIRWVTSLDLSKCFKQIKKQRLLLMCVSISELPSDISTMVKALNWGYLVLYTL